MFAFVFGIPIPTLVLACLELVAVVGKPVEPAEERSNGLRPLPPGPTGGIGTATKGNREGHREVAGATCNFPYFGWNLPRIYFLKGFGGKVACPYGS